MKVQLTKNHRGWETLENFVVEGTVIDLPEKNAQALLDCGWAVEAGKKSPVPEEIPLSEPEEWPPELEVPEQEDVSGIDAVMNTENYIENIPVVVEESESQEIKVAEEEEVPLENMTYNEIRQLAKSMGIKATGTKDDLIFAIELELD